MLQSAKVSALRRHALCRSCGQMPIRKSGTKCAPTPSMRIAIPHWENRVSPMLDVAGHAVVFDVENGATRRRSEVGISQSSGQSLAGMLANHSVDVVICGTVSRELAATLRGAGIELVTHICGPVEEVLNAYLRDGLNDDTYRMPGCCRRRLPQRNRQRCQRRRGDSAPPS